MLEILEYIRKTGEPDHKQLINRELSWLSFNARVLQEAEDEKNPLIERMRFLGIFSNNLDEFFRVRVATMRRLAKMKKLVKENGGENPVKILNKIRATVLAQQTEFHRVYRNILNSLKREGIYLLNENQLNERQSRYVKNYFHRKVHPALVPLMVHDVEKFPHLRDRSIYFAIKLSRSGSEEFRYSLLEIPTAVLPRFLPIPGSDRESCVIILDDVIRHCLKEVYAILNYDRIEAYTVKITRDAELDFDDDVSKTFLDKMKKSLKKRKTAGAVRFIYDGEIPEDMLEFFTSKLGVDKNDSIIPGGRYHNFKDFMNFPDLGREYLLHKPRDHVQHPRIKPYKSILDVVAKRDVLLHYPYHSFNYFIALLREAAIDPKVLSIKITIYRLARKSKVINALINAAKNGKKVIVVVELQARFDEEANIRWARVLSEEGVEVVFGMSGLKVHSKLCLIEREENGSGRHFLSVGTGNYNEQTAELYSDMALFTAHRALVKEAAEVFDGLIGTSRSLPETRHLILSPGQLRGKMEQFINREIKNKLDGYPAYIHLKMNSLVDPGLIGKLYEASAAGVEVKLNVRGTCSLIPGKRNLSENIEAISILDKYLEHTRIYAFCNKGRERIYLSSADWMGRNLDARVEVTCPVYDKKIHRTVRDFLNLQWSDNVKARILDKKQTNTFKPRKPGEPIVRSQFEMFDYYEKANKPD